MSTGRASFQGHCRVLLTVTAVLAGLVTAVVATAPVASAADPGVIWQVTDQLGLDGSSAAVDCPTATECWAIEGGELLSTADLGAHWTDRGALIPSTVTGLDDIACPAAGRCRIAATTATGDVMLAIDAGHLVSRPITTLSGELRLDCFSASNCIVTNGSNTVRTSDSGQTWSSAPLPRQVTAFAMSCAVATAGCWIVGYRFDGRSRNGYVARTRDGGATWQSRAVPDRVATFSEFDDIDCVSATTCTIVGSAESGALVLRTTDGGTSWLTPPLPTGLRYLRSVACSTALVCRAVGVDNSTSQRQAAISTTNGSSWTTDPIGDRHLAEPVDVGCGVGKGCVVVTTGRAQRAVAPDDHWEQVSLPAAADQFEALSCSNVAWCVGVGVDLADRPFALRGVPGAWTESTMPEAVGRPNRIDCASRTVCVVLSTAVGTGRRGVWRTADGGATWTAGVFPAPVLGTHRSISCPTATVCLATGGTTLLRSELRRTVDGGATWSQVELPSGLGGLGDIACATATSCVVLAGTIDGPAAWRTTDLGTTFVRAPLTPDGSGRFTNIECWAVVCLASGSDDDEFSQFARSTDQGRTWTVGRSPRPLNTYEALACNAQGRCVATAFVDNTPGSKDRPLVSADGGLTWRNDKLPGSTRYFPTTVACRPGQCFVLSSPAVQPPLSLAEPLVG